MTSAGVVMDRLLYRSRSFDVINERGFGVRGAHPSKIATSGAAILVMMWRRSQSYKGGPAGRALTQLLC